MHKYTCLQFQSYCHKWGKRSTQYVCHNKCISDHRWKRKNVAAKCKSFVTVTENITGICKNKMIKVIIDVKEQFWLPNIKYFVSLKISQVFLETNMSDKQWILSGHRCERRDMAAKCKIFMSLKTSHAFTIQICWANRGIFKRSLTLQNQYGCKNIKYL